MSVEGFAASAGERVVDKGFRPNITSRGLGTVCLSVLQRWDMDPVGFPLTAQLPTRRAVWFGNVPNGSGEVPLIVVASKSKFLTADDTWFSGRADFDQLRLGPSRQDLELYADEAFQRAFQPEAAIAQALLLVEGPTGLPKDLERYVI